MLETVQDQARQNYGAFFSSVLGGIVTDPAVMTLPIDDHLVHRCWSLPPRALVSCTIELCSGQSKASRRMMIYLVLSVPSDAPRCNGE